MSNYNELLEKAKIDCQQKISQIGGIEFIQFVNPKDYPAISSVGYTIADSLPMSSNTNVIAWMRKILEANELWGTLIFSFEDELWPRPFVKVTLSETFEWLDLVWNIWGGSHGLSFAQLNGRYYLEIGRWEGVYEVHVINL